MALVPEAFRFRRNLIAARGVELLAPILRTHAAIKCSGNPGLRPVDWRRVLILGDNHIGDVLYRTSSLGPLKQGLPHCEFYYLTTKTSAPLLENNPWLAEVLAYVTAGTRLSLRPEYITLLRAKKFDAVLCTNVVNYGADLRLGLCLHIPTRVGYVFKGFSGWVNHPVPITWPSSYPAYFREMVAHLTGRNPDWPLQPCVYPTSDDVNLAGQFWNQLNLPAGRPTLACFVTSRQPSGIWPREFFSSALQAVRSAMDVNLLLCGAAGDSDMLTKMNIEHGLSATICAGILPLRALVILLRRCAVVLATDSGPRHLANAAGIPVVFVRNLWFNRIEAGSYCTTDVDMAVNIGELPPNRQDKPLRKTTPELVANRLLSLIEQRKSFVAPTC